MKYDEQSYIIGLWVVFFPDESGNWIAIVDRETDEVWRTYIRFLDHAVEGTDRKSRYLVHISGTEADAKALVDEMAAHVMRTAHAPVAHFIPVGGNAEAFRHATSMLPWVQHTDLSA